jgi:hypothetical protein
MSGNGLAVHTMARNRIRGKSRTASNMAVFAVLSVFLSAFLVSPQPVTAGEGGDGGSGGGSSSGSGSGGGPGASAGSASGASGGHGVGPATPFGGGLQSAGDGAEAGSSQKPSESGREAPRALGRRTEQDRAREAVRLGWIQPLETVFTAVRQSVPGEVLSVGLRRESDGSWIYALTLLTPEGAYRDVVVDARLGQILRIRRR